jgi:hypothetical protein
MAWTTAQLDALETAISNGSLSVEYGDKKVVYRSLDEMLKLREIMKRELYGSATSGEASRVKTKFSKGL